MKPFITLNVPQELTDKQIKQVHEFAKDIEPIIGIPGLVTFRGMDIAVHQDLQPLVEAIDRQTEAIHSLVRSNADIIGCFVDAMAEDEDQPQTHYLDGAPIIEGL